MLNDLLIGSDWRLRNQLWVKYRGLVDKLVQYIFTCGDYDIQTSITETLFRYIL